MKQEIMERIEKIRKGEIPEGYRKTMVGIVVKEWDLIELRTVFEEVSELTSDIQKYPLSSLTIQTGVEAKTQRYERSFLITKEGDNYKIVSKDQFVFNPMNIRFGAIGRYKGETKVCVSGYYNVFRCINGNNPAYMEYLLKDYRMIQLYNKYALGSLIEKQRLHYSHFIKFKIPLPHIIEQQKITDILSTWDKAIELKEKLIDEKKEFKRGLMQKLLTGEIRFSEFTDEWKNIKLKNLVSKMQSGGTPKSSEVKYYNGKIPFVKINDITVAGKYLRKTTTNINEEGLKNSSSWLVPVNSILYCMYASVGVLCINKIPVATSQAIINIIPNNNVDLEYLYYFLLNHKTKISRLIETGTQGNINAGIVRDIQVNLPSFEEQIKISLTLSNQDREIELLEKEVFQLKNEKKGLKQLLLTGIIRVEVD